MPVFGAVRVLFHGMFLSSPRTIAKTSATQPRQAKREQRKWRENQQPSKRKPALSTSANNLNSLAEHEKVVVLGVDLEHAIDIGQNEGRILVEMDVAAIPNYAKIHLILLGSAEVGELALVKLYFVTTVSDNLIGSAAGFPDSCDDWVFVNLEDDPDILPCFRQHGREVP